MTIQELFQQRARGARPGRGRKRGGGRRAAGRAGAGVARADRGAARHRQDADGARARPRRRAGLRAHPVHARPDAGRPHRHAWCSCQNEGRFELRKGPVFASMVLADEINRTPPKTQAALLEAMEEGQVTIEGETLPLPRPFIVCATENPIEFEGTYPLPEAQLDRFLFKLLVELSRPRGRARDRAPPPERLSLARSGRDRGAADPRPGRRCPGCAPRPRRSRSASRCSPTSRSISQWLRASRRRRVRAQPARLDRPACWRPG